jgi:hypothetical protein
MASVAHQIKSREQQMRIQLLQQHNAHLHGRDHPSLLNGAMTNSHVSAFLASKLIEEGRRNHGPMDSEASQQLLEANKMALLKSAANHTG